jgi:cell division protein FtsQ
MAVKRKISIRKILQVFLTLVVTTGCVMAMVSASKIEDKKLLKEVVVHFKNDKKYHFIQEQEIMDLAINSRHIDIMHTPISRLDIRTMEQLIMNDPWVAFAQVYVDNERVLHMYVTQRIPVARVFQQNGNSFYLDTTLSIMPLSEHYVYYTTVVTNVPQFKNDSTSWSLRKDIIALTRYLQADTFWNAQVSQVVVDSPGMYEFVPILGDHRIILGDANATGEKLRNLFTFYKGVLNRIGWDKYQVLDVRFKDQVVASPSLPYSGPVDKEVNKMNWINSIVETEAANENKDSVHAAAPAQPPVVKPATPAGPAKKPVAIAVKKGSSTKNSTKADNKKQASPKYIYPAKRNN